jgi:hypothetical protein
MPKLLQAGQAAAALCYDSLGSGKLLLLPPVDNPRNVIDYPLFCARAEVMGLVCTRLFTCRRGCTCHVWCACTAGVLAELQKKRMLSASSMASLAVQAVERAVCK